jgi:hypothetical protein
MAENTAKFFTPTYAKVCSNKSGDIISLYLSNASRTAVEIDYKNSRGKITLQIKAMDATSESTSLRQFVGLEDPSMPKIIAFCAQESSRLLNEADIAKLQEAIEKLG